MIISIHIPKTGGTTLGMYLDYGFQRRIFYDYEGYIVKDDPEEIQKFKPFLDKFAVIHGHIAPLKYIDVFTDAKYVTCLRHPVERTISNYYHMMREKNLNYKPYAHVVKNNLDIVGFAEWPTISRAQSLYMRGIGIYNFDFVGITEELETSIDMMCRFLGIDKLHPFTNVGQAAAIPSANVNPNKGFVSEDIRKKIEKICEEDMELYRKGLEIFRKLKSKLM